MAVSVSARLHLPFRSFTSEHLAHQGIRPSTFGAIQMFDWHWHWHWHWQNEDTEKRYVKVVNFGQFTFKLFARNSLL